MSSDTRMSGGVFVDARNEDQPDQVLGCQIELHLPCPPSVNETRKIDFRFKTKHDQWARRSDQHVMMQRKACHRVTGPYAAHIVVSEKVRLDLDNVIKATLDYLVNIEMVPGDSRKFLRKLTVSRGIAPEGVLVRVWSV